MEVAKMDRPNAWNSYKKAQLKEVDALAKDYINFISEGKSFIGI